tara:strand:- start:2861 stop:3631 length:771 start_codon:yes stop_codon:yes gene_type:complete
MATTYLELTNELLRELNEIPLTASDFPTAVGVQAHVKDTVNKAYFDMINQEPQWPFLSAGESGEVNPMYGNVYVETVIGQRYYELKASSDSIINDYGSVDWDNFYLTTVGVSGETAPYTGTNLRYVTNEQWKTFRRVSENLDQADTTTYGTPNSLIRSPDARKFGLSPIPDKVYRVWFYAWDLPTKFTNPTDTVVFPEMYSTTLLARARYYIWQFKDNPQAAAFALDDYKKGMRSMRSNLIEPTPFYMSDDRVRYT